MALPWSFEVTAWSSGELMWNGLWHGGPHGELQIGRTDVVQLAVAQQEICALFRTGEVGCVRHGACQCLTPLVMNPYGSSGNPSRLESCEPTTFRMLDELRDIVQIAAAFEGQGFDFCAVRRSGHMTCWSPGMMYGQGPFYVAAWHAACALGLDEAARGTPRARRFLSGPFLKPLSASPTSRGRA